MRVVAVMLWLVGCFDYNEGYKKGEEGFEKVVRIAYTKRS